METQTIISRDILYDFLDKWPADKIREMPLQAYVSVGDKDTFCQWLETRTRELGSINGLNSSKFGIYKRRDKKKTPKSLINDNEYSWQRFYGSNDRSEAFTAIRNEVAEIIEYSASGQFEKIDTIHLTQFVKWKIAYLYSNERLIPIFKKDTLVKIGNHFGLKADTKTPISEIQKVMIANKPAHLSIYEYSGELYNKFRTRKKVASEKGESKRKVERDAAKGRDVLNQNRRGAAAYVATQKHNLLQEALRSKLEKHYGKENVIMEKNFVDLKVIQPNKILLYEVKSCAYASDCIREALGQILSYSQRDSEKKPKRLIVAGQYQPNMDEIEFIKYVKKNLKLDFDYEHIDLDPG